MRIILVLRNLLTVNVDYKLLDKPQSNYKYIANKPQIFQLFFVVHVILILFSLTLFILLITTTKILL